MTAAIEIAGLRKRYGRHVALDGLSFDVPRGAVFGLLGPNGAGKSTTFGVLCGWLRADDGTARVLGEDARTVHRLAGRIAALPQDAFFAPDLTIQRELAHFAMLSGVAPERADAEANRALARVGLEDAADKRGGELSHGMAKRAGLAQCLLGSPEVVFLDEPTAGLDPRHARQVRDLIVELGRTDATVVVSSHNLAEIEDVCTHGAILDRGRLTACGTIDELTSRGGLIVVELAGDAAAAVRQLPIGDVIEGLEVEAGRFLAVRGRPGVEPAALVRAVLSPLLAAEVPVLSVQRGRSLERAFLDVTDAAGAAP